MRSPRWFRILIGNKARVHLQHFGCAPDSFEMLLAASGGPRWIGLVGLDRALARFLSGRSIPENQRLPLMGASSGAWRVAAMACDTTGDTYEELIEAYITQCYSGKPSQRQVSDTCRAYLEQVFTPGRIDFALNNPKFETRFTTAIFPDQHSGRLLLLTKLILALTLNAVDRRLLSKVFRRGLFVADHSRLNTDFQQRSWDHIATQMVALESKNFLIGLLASGSIPFVLEGECDIPGAGPGLHLDGGLIDYHFEVEDRGPILYPHFSEEPIPGWLDRFPPHRRISRQARENLCLILPSLEMISKFPGQGFPVRQDFEHLSNEVRMKRWRQTAEACEPMERELQACLDAGELLDVAQPF